MVTTTAVTRRIDTGLQLVRSDVEALPELADQWNDLPESTRASLALEWAHSMADYLTELDECYCANKMTPSQQELYLVLCQRLEEVRPIITRLNLFRPRVKPLP